MNNIKVISVDNLLHNIAVCKKQYPNICAMVKANAYGHGAKKIVQTLKDKVNMFGVASVKEAICLRKKFKDINILVVGKSNDFLKLIKNRISFCVDTLVELIKANEICKKLDTVCYVHIAVNSGMNRIGVKDIEQFKQMLSFIKSHKCICLQGVFTHAFDADCNNTHFYEQMSIFYKFVKCVDNKSVIIHIGGSYVLKHKIPNFVNMVRVGFFIYGYGQKKLRPVMKICSKITKIFDCKIGEYVGYGNKTILDKDTKIAVAPIGYADGVMRRLSNNYCVNINGTKCKVIGNVCMDMLMIDVSNIGCKVGDLIVIMDNALDMAKVAQTSPYEILTSFNLMR